MLRQSLVSSPTKTLRKFKLILNVQNYRKLLNRYTTDSKSSLPNSCPFEKHFAPRIFYTPRTVFEALKFDRGDYLIRKIDFSFQI